MKTYKAWERSNLDLNEYLGKAPCQIDEKIYLHIGETVSPKFCGDGFIQCGEPMFHKGDDAFYETVTAIGDKYYYLGVLPEFKQ